MPTYSIKEFKKYELYFETQWYIFVSIFFGLLFLNIIPILVYVLSHFLRKTRPATKKECERAEAEVEEEFDGGPTGVVVQSKSMKSMAPNSKVQEKTGKPKEFKFDGQSKMDNETIMLQTADANTQNDSRGPLHSKLTNAV